MLLHLIAIAVVYGLAVGWVHLMYAHSKWAVQKAGNRKQLRYLLFTSNVEHNIEWIIRALWLYALLRGRGIQVIVVDDGSTDHTLAILERMSGRTSIDLRVVPREQSQSEEISPFLSTVLTDETIIVDLTIPLEAGRIPYVQG